MRSDFSVRAVVGILMLLSVLVLLGACTQPARKSVEEQPTPKETTTSATPESVRQKPATPPKLNLRALIADPMESSDVNKLASRYAFGDAVILASYQTSGNVEACGCSPFQLGGLPPRGGLIDVIRGSGPTLTIDLGGVTDGSKSFNLLKAKYVLKGMALAGYDAMGLGVAELKVAPRELLNLLEGAEIPFYAGNAYAVSNLWKPSRSSGKRYQQREVLPPMEPATLPSWEEGTAKTYTALAPPGFIWNTEGGRIGILFLNFTALSEADLELPGYVLVDPREWLDAWSERGYWRLADFWVLAAEGYSAKIAELLKDYPQFNLVLTGDFHLSGRDEEEMLQPVVTDNGATWLNTFNFGGYLALANLEFPLSRGSKSHLVAYNLPVVSTFSPDPDILKMVKGEYHDALAGVFREQSFEHRASVIIEPRECGECHQEAYEVFKKSQHTKSLQALREKGQEHNVECLSCHVVYDFTEDKMYPLQCVSCHRNMTYRHIAEARSELELSEKDDASFTYEFCARCHTPRQSTRFRKHFEEYVSKVRH